MSKVHKKEVYNKFILKESYLTNKYFEDDVAETVIWLQKRYPDAKIEAKRNKNGVRLLAIYYN